MKSSFVALLVAVGIFGFSLVAAAQDVGTLTPEKAKRISDRKQYSPYANRRHPTRPLFGDTQLHTGKSLDAGVWGTSLMPRDAYRFARGEQVTSSTGQPVKPVCLKFQHLVGRLMTPSDLGSRLPRTRG